MSIVVELVAKRRHSRSYLQAVYEAAQTSLPGWAWKEIHRRAFPTSGGRARHHGPEMDMPGDDEDEEETPPPKGKKRAAAGGESGGGPARELVLKPFPNEHAARQKDPDGFQPDSFRRKQLAPGVTAVLGRPKGKTTAEVQALRFDRTKFSAAQAKAWLKAHDFSAGGFEEATGKAAEIVGVRMLKAAEDQRLLYLVAMRPEVADTDKEAATRGTVRAAAHGFMFSRQVGLNHVTSAPAYLVESYMAPVGFDTIEGAKLSEPVLEGDWIVVIKVASEQLWAHRHEITGVSIGGTALRVPIQRS